MCLKNSDSVLTNNSFCGIIKHANRLFFVYNSIKKGVASEISELVRQYGVFLTSAKALKSKTFTLRFILGEKSLFF